MESTTGLIIPGNTKLGLVEGHENYTYPFPGVLESPAYLHCCPLSKTFLRITSSANSQYTRGLDTHEYRRFTPPSDVGRNIANKVFAPFHNSNVDKFLGNGLLEINTPSGTRYFSHQVKREGSVRPTAS